MDFYLNDAAAAKRPIWTEKFIDEIREKIRAGIPYSGYGQKASSNVALHIRNFLNVVVDSHVLVIGTEQPWIEALLLEHGVGNITVLDYQNIISLHPKIRAVTPGWTFNYGKYNVYWIGKK